MTVLEILSRAIRTAGSQNKVAIAMQVASPSVGDWLAGKSVPTPEKEPRLSWLSGVPPDVVKETLYQARLLRAVHKNHNRSPIPEYKPQPTGPTGDPLSDNTRKPPTKVRGRARKVARKMGLAVAFYAATLGQAAWADWRQAVSDFGDSVTTRRRRWYGPPCLVPGLAA